MNKPFISVTLPSPIQAKNLLQQLQWLIWEIPVHISSFSSATFLREIRELEILIRPYIDDIPQSDMRRVIMDFERELTNDTSRRFALHGPAWIPGRDERRYNERKLDRTSVSSVSFTVLVQRYEGLRSRIESAKQRFIQPSLLPKQSPWETTQQHQSYIRLFGFNNELKRILNDIPSLDKTARPYVKKRIVEIGSLAGSMDTRDMSEWGTLQQSIQLLVSNCLEAIQKKPKPSLKDAKESSMTYRSSRWAVWEWVVISAVLAPNNERILQNQPYIEYLEALSSVLRNVTAIKNQKSFWDGPFRQSAVSPFINQLRDKLSWWYVDAHSFSWDQIVTDMHITDNYWQTVQKKLQASTNAENFETNMDSFFALIESVIDDSRINCLVLRSAISWFRSKTSYSTHDISK
jgi:hypothetical protein